MTKAPLFLILICIAVCFYSCAPAPIVKEPVQYPVKVVYPTIEPRTDIWHVVAPGETLWRLSKIYQVNIDDIKRVNNLSNTQTLEMGQRLLIPDATSRKSVIPIYLYDTNKWRYIIIHHSATDEDNSLSLYWMHIKRGFNEGLGYHFVIDNGTYGKGNGEIEISPRWIKQRNGAHCKASGMNTKGIGICLVGNFSKDRVSQKQLDSLVQLVNILREHYKIPKENIMGHGEVPGARTECPGTNFPWYEFWKRLDEKKSRPSLIKE
ncbi:MAG: N-acetylmuramoyl-L-alanine amidase [Candidatus Omnitrophota bacterium]